MTTLFFLPTATSRGSSTQAMPTHTPPPSHYYSRHKYQADEEEMEGVVVEHEQPPGGETSSKKRKVAPVPPPGVYAGFSSTQLLTQHQRGGLPKSHSAATSSSTKYETSSSFAPRRPGGPAPSSSSAEFRSSHVGAKATGGGVATGGGQRVRKVHRFNAGSASTDLITPSSWRAGKELAEQILREQREREREACPVPPSHSPTASSSHLSDYQDSLDANSAHSHSTTTLVGRSPGSVGSRTSPMVEDRPPPGGLSLGGVADSDADLDLYSASGSDGSRPVPRLPSDMQQLLEELERGEGAEETMPPEARLDARPLGGKAKGRGQAAEPANKKTKYNSGK